MANSQSKTATIRTFTKPKVEKAQTVGIRKARSQNPDQPRRTGKLDLIRSLLERPEGATLDELVTATGWQPHSVRAGMTGLRKQGLTVTRTKVDGTTCFSIDAQPAEASA